MSVVDDVGDGVIVERPRVESASQFQHLGRLLADLRRWDNGLFASRLIGQAGLPGIEYALRVLGPGAAEMVDHRVLIADNRVLVARPEFAVNRISASRAGHHQIGLKQDRLLRFGIRSRVAVTVSRSRSTQ